MLFVLSILLSGNTSTGSDCLLPAAAREEAFGKLKLVEPGGKETIPTGREIGSRRLEKGHRAGGVH